MEGPRQGNERRSATWLDQWVARMCVPPYDCAENRSNPPSSLFILRRGNDKGSWERRVKIGIIVAPFIAVPPVDYAGTELFVAHLTEESERRDQSSGVYGMENRPLVLSGAGSTHIRNGL